MRWRQACRRPELPFAIVQGIVLVFFVVIIIGVIRRYRPMPKSAATELSAGI
ncbi:hypothetical protein H8A99_03845 [Bradyrhizobium sp. Arg68]|uniref:hypothetical protein n=1 Tax=Bradyrhizobium ivorense TaxID=2511166 RepID=UPI0035561050|nr:hypothetical protein [Bradyrhizobium ivorense]